MQKLSFFFIFFIMFYFAYPQGHGGKPLTYSQKYLSLFYSGKKLQPNIAILNASLQNAKLERQKADNLHSDIFGKVIPVDINIKSFSSLRYLADSSKLYLMKITSDSALSMSFKFDKFWLPIGSRLFLYNSDTTMFCGSFNEQNNRPDSTFSIPSILRGETIFVEYYEPKITNCITKLHMCRIAHIFRREQ